MSGAEEPHRLQRASAGEVTVEDVRALMGASTPHFALQLRDRIKRLIADIAPGHPARVEGEREMRRLELLGFEGEVRGESDPLQAHPLPSLAGASAADAP